MPGKDEMTAVIEKHIGAALSQLRLRLSRSGFLRLFL